ncbi:MULTISPECIES: AI-2E family transporter [unclassified Acinetobacter]|uniref:AI-2E family transporter n=1 Tax=unclassified Acinetobacter TaxID=196816 RepID=UPI00293504B2|nr:MULTISPECIES: AI-2E family transporter [unclassified Acinetobacter]WOE30924.1 AI-2E family transporter [Acinetobacter sp. SAAs470]WOE39120.1 AI-2E family transporter [Acinetobacter sp. SAAs474]
MQLLNDKNSLIASYLLIFIFLAVLIPLHLTVSFFSGFLVFSIIHSLSKSSEKYIDGRYARLTFSIVISLIIIGLIVLGIARLISFIHYDLQGARLDQLNTEIDILLQQVQAEIIKYYPNFNPYTTMSLKDQLFAYIKENLGMLRHTGTNILHSFASMIIAMIIGIMVSLHQVQPKMHIPAFKVALIARIQNLATAFQNVVFAQVKISLINTILFIIFAHIILPICGFHLPFVKTLTILTFIFGLIPIIGNLITNTLITVAALTISVSLAIVSLAYLIIIHKLEYFINARIIGTKINASAWEVLLAMLIFEAIFGITGLIVAPIYYAYLKLELKQQNMI